VALLARPAANEAVVHPEQRAVGPRVAVLLGQGSLSRSSDVGEDELGADLVRKSVQVAVGPGGRDGEEDARRV